MIPSNAMTRRALLGGLISFSALAATPAFASAPAVLRGAGEFRKLAMVNTRTDEWIDTVYWVDGDYIAEALEAMNHLLRDWREDQACRMDPRVLDIMAATHARLETSESFTVISGYRTPATNALLRRRSRGVAKNSYHIKGMAVDLRLANRSVDQISRAALSLGAGGVGRYSRSEFVHVDCGPVRDWGA